jgi:hypothetical protein
MITCSDDEAMNNTQLKKFFTDENATGFYEWCNWPAEKGLERLVFRVTRNPNDLHAHLERIYYCFQEHLDEQLLGALIDLLIVLNNTGGALGRRMIAGSKSRMTENQFHALNGYLENTNANIPLLSNNRFSVFAKWLNSFTVMVRVMNEGSV